MLRGGLQPAPLLWTMPPTPHAQLPLRAFGRTWTQWRQSPASKPGHGGSRGAAGPRTPLSGAWITHLHHPQAQSSGRWPHIHTWALLQARAAEGVHARFSHKRLCLSLGSLLDLRWAAPDTLLSPDAPPRTPGPGTPRSFL